MIFAWKIYKIPEFYMIFARKNARILHNTNTRRRCVLGFIYSNWSMNLFTYETCPKNILSRILGGHVPPVF